MVAEIKERERQEHISTRDASVTWMMAGRVALTERSLKACRPRHKRFARALVDGFPPIDIHDKTTPTVPHTVDTASSSVDNPPPTPLLHSP